MSTDFRDYFNTRLTQELDRSEAAGITSKFDALQKASTEKAAQLREFAAQKQAKLDALNEANKTSIVNKLGLDEEGITAQAVNAGASLASGASRLAGNTLALPSSLAAQAETASLNDEDFAAYKLYQEGDRSEATMARLSRVPTANFTLGDVNRAFEGQFGDATVLQRIEQGSAQRQAARSINDAFDISNRVNQTRRQAFSEDLTQDFDTNWGNVTEGWKNKDAGKLTSGIAGLLSEAGRAAVDNPGAVSEYVIENIPQLAVGALGNAGKAAMIAGNVGYAADAFQKGIEKYQKENNGAYPDEKTRNEMALWAASLAAAEQVGDASILKGAKNAAEATRASFKGALLGTGKATAAEAGTEGFQTYGEGKAGLKPASAQEIYEGAVIGGLSGGVMAGGPSLVGAAANAGSELSKATRTDAEKAAATLTETVKEAIKTGDVSALTNPDSPTYAPSRAIGALIGNTQAAKTPEEKAANLGKAEEIIASLNTAKEEATTALEQTSVEGLQKSIDAYQTKLDGLDTTDPANARQAEVLTLGLEALRQEMDALTANPKEAEAVARDAKAKLTKVEQELRNATSAAQMLRNLVNPAPEDAPVETPDAELTASDVAKLLDDADKGTEEAVAKVITLAMRSPETLDAVQVARLVNNASNGLTVDQRDYLRAFSEARIAANELRDMEMVSDEIINGSSENKGIATYRKEINQALQANNTKAVNKSLTGLRSFAVDHAAKAAIAEQALAQGSRTQIVRSTDGTWAITDAPMSKEALRKNGGLEVNSPKLVAAIKAEATALNKAVAEMEAAVAIAGKKGTGNVSNQPQQAQQTTQDTKAVPVQTASPVASPASNQGAGDGNPGRTVSKPSTNTNVPAQSVELLSQRLEYMNNPPADYTPEKGKKILAWAKKQLENVTAALASEEEGSDRYNDLDEARSIVKALVKKAASVVEGDESLAEVEGTAAVPPTEPKVAESSTVEAETTTVDKESKESNTTEVQPTQATTEKEATESEERTSEDTVTTEEQSSSNVLTAFNEVGDEATPYYLQNLIARYWTQKAKNPGDASGRPLASVKDFYSALKAGTTKISDFLNEGVLSEEQQNAIKHFFGTAKRWMMVLESNMPKKKADEFRTDEMIQYLLTNGANGVDMDENVKMAIIAGAYSYLLDAAGKPAQADNKTINSILGRGKDAFVSHRLRKEIGTAGNHAHLVYDQIGGRVIDALGLFIKPTASQEQMPKLRTELGIVAVMLLEDMKDANGKPANLVSRTIYGREEFLSLLTDGLSDKARNKVLEKNKEISSFATQTFIAVARNPDGSLPAGVASIVEANKGSKSIVNKLFKVEGAVRFPSLEPIKNAQKKASQSPMDVPSDLRDVIKKNQARPRKFVKDMVAVAAAFDLQEFEQLAGVKPLDEAVVHVVNRSALEAKNQGLQRELRLLMEWAEEMSYLEGGQDSEFYLEFDVWKQQRVGIKTNGLNPQTSKIVRHMIGSPEWESTIRSNDEEAMTSFFLRVAEGLGVKTEAATNAKQLEGIVGMLKQPVYANAITALRKIQNGETVSQTDKEAIKAGVTKGKENLHSLASLVAMARQQNAEAQAQGANYEFTTQLMGEVDGVANGTMLNHALLGAGNTEEGLIGLLNMGAFFEEGSQYTQFSQYREAGNLDVYQDTAREVFVAVKRMMNTSAEMAQQIAAVWNIAGEIFNEGTGAVTKAGRDLMKGALNPLAFGSAMEKIIQGMSDTFLEAVYSGFEGLAKEGADQKKIDAYVDSINALIDVPKYRIQKGHGIVWHMSRPLSPKTEEAIKESFAATVGQATADAVEKKFAAFIAARDSLNYVAQTTYSLYEAVYGGMRAAYVSRLVSNNQLPTNQNGKVIGDLSAEQEAEFAKQMRAVEPIIQTAFSNQSGEERAGLRGAKTKRKRNPNELYTAKVYFNKKQADGKASVGSGGLSSVTESPGVAMGSATTHSFDSWVSHSVQAVMDVLNVHDAIGTGVLKVREGAGLINQKLFEGLINYSPAEEVYRSLSNVVAGIADLVQSNALSQEALGNLQKVLYKISKDMETTKGNALQSLLSYAKQEAYNANTMKLRVLAKIAYVDQYAFEGGNYKVTEQDRDLIAQKLAEQSPDLTTQDLISLEALKNLANVKKVPDSKALAIAPQVSEEVSYEDGDEFDVVGEAPTTKPTNSAFGALGKPTIAADKDLVSFFEQNQETTAERVIQGLYRKYSNDASLPNREFNLTLLKALRKVIDPSMKVRYITPETEANSVLEVPKSASRGWYSVQGAAEEINVLSPDFAASGLTPELLLHELTHSALLQAMRSGSPEVQPFIDNLNKLMGRAKEYAESNDLFESHKDAFENLDEFVTWGMTNAEFQQEVLSQFYMKPADGTKSLVTALQDFIKSLTDMLFTAFRKADGSSVRKSVGNNVNGMAIMINDAVQIMNKAAQTKKGNVTATASMAAKINAMTTLDIHHALNDGKVSREFQEQIGTVLISIVNKLHGPFGAFLDSMKSAQAITPLDVWTKALDTGVAPFASKVLASGFEVSQQEAFAIEQIEATVRAALDGNEANTKFAYRELAALYAEARKKLTVEKFHNGDWATATQSEKDNAQALHDFVFALEKTNGDRMDHLSRFAALGLGHEGFNKLLQMNTEIQMGRVAKADTLVQKLQAVFQNILEMLSNKITGTYGGQRADVKLTKLVSNLVDIEAKKRHRLAMEAAKASVPAQKNLVDDASEAVRKGVNNVLNTSVIKNSSFRLVRGAGAAGRLVVNNQVEALMDTIADLRDKEQAGRPGILAGTFNTVRGPKAVMEAMVRAAKGYEGRRKDVITAYSKMASQAFGKALNRDQKASITRVLLRTGASTLMGSMSLADIEKVLSDKTALSKAIADAEKALAAFPQFQHYYKAQANALAFAKVVRNAGGFTMMNAGNIARMLGTVHVDKVSGKALTEATQAIEKLVALYAIDYSPSADRAKVSEIMRDELLRTDGGNGVEFVLKAHKRLEDESKERLFKGQDALMMHGHTSEIYDPHVEVITALESESDSLEERGYVKVGPVGYDQADPDSEPKAIFVLKDGGLNQYLSGALSISNKKAKGTNKHSGYMNPNTFDGAMTASMQAEIMNNKQQEIADMFKPAPRKDLSKEKGNKLAPVVNANGQIVNWRYLMSEKNKDTLLDRDNSFDNIIGAIAGSIYDKSTTQEQNSQVLETLKKVYDDEVSRNPDSFIEVGPGSKDPEMLEIWNMLPPETKATAKRIFGASGIRVRKDSLDLVFGYRKLSLATLFDKENRNALEDVFVATVEGALVLYAHAKGMQGKKAQDYAKRAAVVVTRSERIWQSLVQETKDIIVVKTGTVLLGNVWSNLSLLWLKGVSFKEMAQHHAVAMAGATAYMADSEELARLRLLVQAGYAGTEEGGMKAIQEKILVLEDALARNPVRELIEAGLMPSIVEDVAAEEDPYSYKSLLVRKMEEATAGVPKPLINAAKAVYMAKDGALYKGLYRATQLSDFVARYTLYQHLISREQNPMSKEAALFEASESFVNYDLPMHRALQYTDDMGLTPFLKYFLNIQRVIQKTVRDNPARVLAMAALGNVMDLGPIVLSSAAVTRIGNNPLESGAFKIFGTVDDLATINASMSLIK